MSKIFSHTFNICHGGLSVHNLRYGTIHHRYKELPDDVMRFIIDIPGIVSIYDETAYEVSVLIGECFDATEIVSSICNKIIDKWEAENGKS